MTHSTKYGADTPHLLLSRMYCHKQTLTGKIVSLIVERAVSCTILITIRQLLVTLLIAA